MKLVEVKLITGDSSHDLNEQLKTYLDVKPQKDDEELTVDVTSAGRPGGLVMNPTVIHTATIKRYKKDAFITTG